MELVTNNFYKIKSYFKSEPENNFLKFKGKFRKVHDNLRKLLLRSNYWEVFNIKINLKIHYEII